MRHTGHAAIILRMLVDAHPLPVIGPDIAAACRIELRRASRTVRPLIVAGLAEAVYPPKTHPQAWRVADLDAARAALAAQAVRAQARAAAKAPTRAWREDYRLGQWPHQGTERRSVGRSYTHDPRYQCAPGEQPWGAGFAAAGIGVDVTTGRPWSR